VARERTARGGRGDLLRSGVLSAAADTRLKPSDPGRARESRKGRTSLLCSLKRSSQSTNPNLPTSKAGMCNVIDKDPTG